MAVGLAAATANAILNGIARSATWTEPAEFWLKLHTGDPGSAGTANAATETTRKQVTFGNAAASGAIANTVAVTWTNVAGSEDYTHWSAWDASTAGNFIMSGTMTANAVTAADTFEIPIGDLDLTVTSLAA